MPTTLEAHIAARAAVECEVGEKLNEAAAVVTAAIEAGHYPDGLTVNLDRGFQMCRRLGPILCPPAPSEA